MRIKLLMSLCCGFLIVSCGFDGMEDQGTAQDNVNSPNIIIILADDLAMSDLGVYGGEIDTLISIA